ncbi:MAG TPA: hypothetical protein VGK73_35415 [Polyangiaceae bacterium]
MRRFALLSLFALALSPSACSGVEPTTVSDAGNGGTGGGASGTSGSTAAGTSSSGSSGASGATSAMGGSSGASTMTGGSAGSVAGTGAGTPNSGGSAGTGGSPAAGTSGLGGAGSGGTGTAGTGGPGNTGGGGASTSGGSAGTDASGGTAGGGMSGTGGGGTTCPTIAELFPTSGNVGSLDGRLVTTPCSPTNSDDCSGAGWIYNGATTPCMNGALTAQQDFAVGGEPGVMYDVTLHFYGVVEPKNYGNMITREAGNTRPMHGANGATPAPWASSNGGVSYPASDYNTYEVHVFNEMDEEIRQYFLNSDTAEGHWTYLINYERTIPVVGGGRVRVKTYDRNCRMIKNCGDRSGGVSFAACSAATKQTTDVSAAMPAAASLNQPGLGQAASESGQWLLIDVTQVECR